MSIKLALIITGLNIGGAESMLLKLLHKIDRQAFSPTVISLTNFGEIGPKIADLGIPVTTLEMRPDLSSLFSFFRLVVLLRQLKPDVVHTWMYHADLLGGLAARCAGITAIGWCIRNSNVDKNLTKFSTRAMVSLCAQFSHWVPRRILSCSEKARQVHIALGYVAEKMMVVPNGFDLSRFKASSEARISVRNELGLSTEILLVGLIGRFDIQKNHAGFFSAASKLHLRMPDVHFVLAGKGIDSSNIELMGFIEDAGLQANTHLLGLRDDMPRLMSALDILVSSSSYGEAFPNVIGEAMACAVPCVVTDVGDSAWIVGDTGKTVPAYDMLRLAYAIEDILLMAPQNRSALGAMARERVSNLFEIGLTVKRYEKFYVELAKNGGISR
jgi:glycosyltransferase involved in cell wall biosynthesis